MKFKKHAMQNLFIFLVWKMKGGKKSLVNQHASWPGPSGTSGLLASGLQSALEIVLLLFAEPDCAL